MVINIIREPQSSFRIFGATDCPCTVTPSIDPTRIKIRKNGTLLTATTDFTYGFFGFGFLDINLTVPVKAGDVFIAECDCDSSKNSPPRTVLPNFRYVEIPTGVQSGNGISPSQITDPTTQLSTPVVFAKCESRLINGHRLNYLRFGGGVSVGENKTIGQIRINNAPIPQTPNTNYETVFITGNTGNLSVDSLGGVNYQSTSGTNSFYAVSSYKIGFIETVDVDFICTGQYTANDIFFSLGKILISNIEATSFNIKNEYTQADIQLAVSKTATSTIKIRVSASNGYEVFVDGSLVYTTAITVQYSLPSGGGTLSSTATLPYLTPVTFIAGNTQGSAFKIKAVYDGVLEVEQVVSVINPTITLSPTQSCFTAGSTQFNIVLANVAPNTTITNIEALNGVAGTFNSANRTAIFSTVPLTGGQIRVTLSCGSEQYLVSVSPRCGTPTVTDSTTDPLVIGQQNPFNLYFDYSNPVGCDITRFRITQLPSLGILYSNGSLVSIGDEIATSSNITFLPNGTIGTNILTFFGVSDVCGESPDSADITILIGSVPNGVGSTISVQSGFTRNIPVLGCLYPQGCSNEGAKITQLPSSGTLFLNGVPVSVNQIIPQESTGNLIYSAIGVSAGQYSIGFKCLGGCGESSVTLVQINVTNSAPSTDCYYLYKKYFNTSTFKYFWVNTGKVGVDVCGACGQGTHVP